MAFGNSGSTGGGNPNRIASFMPTKRQGMFVGPVQMENLLRLVEEAMAAKKGLVFFLWENDGSKGGKSVASITGAVERDREEGAPARRAIGGGGGFGARTAQAPAAAPKGPDRLAGLFGSGKNAE